MANVGINVQTSSPPVKQPTTQMFGDEQGHITGSRTDLEVNANVDVQASVDDVGTFLTVRPNGTVDCKVYKDNVEVAALSYDPNA